MSRCLRSFLVADGRVEPVNEFLAELSDDGVSDADVTVQVLPAPPGNDATFVAVVTYVDRAASAPQPIALAAPAVVPGADPVRIQGSRWR